MECPSCQHANPEGSRFCNTCGAPLLGSCVACGHQNPPGSRFCGQCGIALGAAPLAADPTVSVPTAPTAGERRQATIVFSDLSGYTAMNERLDPEEVGGIMNRIKRDAAQIVERHGGLVNQFVGDEIVALFGIPVAHGDDPSRAVRAALELHELVRELGADIAPKLGRALRLHTGINTGLIVTHHGDDRDGRVGITGDTVNTGARLAALATDDAIVMGPETQQRVAMDFATEPLEPVALKGKAKPIVPHRLLGAMKKPRRATQRFVGRWSELRQFSSIAESCRASGKGHVIFVRGEAGIGKSRLVEEFRGIAAAQGFIGHTGLVLDFGVGRGQDAIQSVMTGLLGIADSDDVDSRRAAIAEAIRAGLMDPDHEPFAADLLEVPKSPAMQRIYEAMDHETRSGRKRATFAGLVRGASAHAPMLIAIEDLHWADETTLGHMAAVAGQIADTATLLVMTSRIEGDPLQAAWRAAIGGTPMLTLDLGPLHNDEALELAGEFIDSSTRFAKGCIERAEGNPLFLEQLLRNAEESDDQGVPGSVQSIVQARVDRLDDADRQALRAASVIGQRFALELLRHLVDDPGYACDRLMAHNLVRPEGEGYLFAHALVREGVYGSLLRSRRRELHCRVAAWFSGRDAVLHAQHLEQGEDAGAAGAYLQAVEELSAAFRYERALQLADRGLALTAEASLRYALISLRGALFQELGQSADSIAAYREALKIAEDDAQRCRAWIGVASGMRIIDDIQGALEALVQAQDNSTGRGLSLELARLHHLRGNLYFPLGNLEGCLREHELAMDYARKAASPEIEADALGGLGDGYYMRGRIVSAHGYFDRCISLCRSHEFRRIEAQYLCMLANSKRWLGDLGGALQGLIEAVEASRKVGHQRAEVVALLSTPLVLFDMGDFERAGEFAERGVELSRRLNATRFEAVCLALLGQAQADLGHRAQGAQFVRQGLELARSSGIHFAGPWIMGMLAQYSESAEERRELLEEAERILQEDCVSHNYFYFYRDGMEAALADGDWARVERHAKALEAYTREEPIPWCDFFIARARALAAWGVGQRDDVVRAEVQRLTDEANRLGFRIAATALEVALAGT